MKAIHYSSRFAYQFNFNFEIPVDYHNLFHKVDNNDCTFPTQCWKRSRQMEGKSRLRNNNGLLVRFL